MKLEILTCAGENGESCTASPKYRIEGKGEFCRKHGMSALFKANLDENITPLGTSLPLGQRAAAAGAKSERG